MKSIAVLIPPAMSAALFCTPALTALSQSARVTCLTASPASQQIAQVCAGVSQVIDVSAGPQPAALDLQADAILWPDFDSESSEAAFAELAQNLAAQGSRVSRLSDSQAHPSKAHQADAVHPVALVKDWLCREVEAEPTLADPGSESPQRYPVAASAEAQARVQRLLPDGRPLLLMHVGCHGVAPPGWRFWRTAGHVNAWPLDGFLQVAAALRQVFTEPRIVLTGTWVENELTQPFARQIPDSLNLVDQTDVPLLLALASRADLVVGNLTGPVHLACATDTCVVAIARESGEGACLADDGAALFPESASRRIARSDDLAQVSPAKVLSECLIALKSAERLPA